MFCYQVAAYRRSEGIDSIVVFGSPVDTRGTLSFGLPEEAAISAAAFLAENVFATRGVPAWMSRTGFRHARPGQVAARSGSTSSASSTTARRCCRASASAASSRPRAGSPGRARRSPT